MKISIPGYSLSSLHTGLSKLALLLVLLMGYGQSQAQVDCSTTMACNDQVQVSLDENCQALIAPDMLLEDPAYGDSEYTVMVMMPDGSVVPNSIVTYDHVGMTLEVSITLTDCGSSCWGNITVEDKLPPQILLCADYEVACGDNTSPGGGIVPFPTASDACSGITDLEFTDVEVNQPCAAMFAKVITRTWTVSDAQGNEAVCTQTINVLRADIDDITFPPNYDDIDEDAFSCDESIALLPNGAPAPSVTGSPAGTNCPNIQLYYEDVIFPICGASIKVLRQWLVVDWCTGEERTENQIIKIIDDVAPICTTPPDFIVDNIPTDQGLCTGTYDVPPPIVVFECSDWTYNVAYKLRDEDGDPFENPIQDNVVFNFDGTYTITGLPQDTTWIIYTLTDACGNVSQCFSEVLVEDQEDPTPVCEGYTVVGLEDIGWANIKAESIDDGSYDNCEIVRFEVRRQSTSCGFFEDLQFGPEVNFCCEDVGEGYIKVVMRAYDAAGNFNDCIVNVTVQDKLAPTISCPAPITLQCNADFTNTAVTGVATAEDNCSVEVTFVDNVNINECGLGTVRRTWTAEDPQGRKASCVQMITIGDNSPFTENNIQWPQDRNLNACDASEVSPEILNSFPILSNTDCANTAISYEDDVFYSVPDYCVKILRHWRVADWCAYNPQEPAYYEYTQKIALYNDVAPVITGCTNKTITAEIGECEATISETLEATDDCTPGALLRYSYTLDQDNDGTIDLASNGNTVNGTFPSGTHRLTWTVVDRCDNEETCSYLITINDNKAPTPICLGSVVWGLDENGEAEVWASDFDLKSEDTCDDSDELTFAFNSSGTMTAMNFTCADVPNGIAASITLQMYVIDSDGNFEFCDVILQLQDSEVNNACQDEQGVGGRIAGTVYNSSNIAMDDVEVELVNMDSQDADMDMTEAGTYTFDNINYYDEYVVAPKKYDGVKNGINTLDLVKIQRHILGIEPLTDPFLIIAADVNNDERVTAADLLSLRKVILGVNAEFPNNTSWRFVPVGFEFADASAPFGFPEKIEVGEFYHNMQHADFVAVKVGDIDNSATVEGLATQTGNSAAIMAVAPEFAAGEIFTVDFTAHELDELVGIQFTLDFDADALSFSTIKSGIVNVDAQHTNLSQTEDGLIAISWNEVNSLDLNSEDVLFSVTFKSRRAGNVADFITVSDALVDAQAYNGDLQANTITLATTDNVGSVYTAARANKLYQNTPNPFTASTTIGFDLAEAGDVLLTVYDIAGAVVTTQKGYYEAGKHSFTLDLGADQSVSGVLFYKLETNGYEATRKMVVIK